MKVFIFMVLLLVGNIYSSPFQEKSFKYRKKITPSFQLKTSNLAKIVLDEEILSNSYMDDIRVVYGNKLVPFVIRVIQKESSQSGGSKTPTILKKEILEDKKLQYTLRLPEIPIGTAYESLEIEADSNFEANVTIAGLLKPDDVIIRNHDRIYRLDESLDTGVKTNVKFIVPDRFLFAKVEIQGPNLNYEFKKANYIPIQQTKEIGKTIPLESIKITNDEDKQSVVYYIPNQNRNPFSKLRISFQEKNFQRRFVIYEFSSVEKEYVYFTEGNLQKTKNEKNEKLEIQFSRESKNPLKLELHYGDNSPLNLTSLELIYSQQELLFEVTPEIMENIESLYLYYGNPYQRPPFFDPNLTNTLHGKETESVYLNLEKQEPNPNFGYSLLEPPVSIWIMRVLFYLGLVVLGYLGYQVFQVYGNTSLSRNVNEQANS